MKIFISHSSKDANIVHQLVALLTLGVEDMDVFYSSDPDTGIEGGQGIMSKINQTLSDCHCFLPIITENYIRSLYCVYELSVSAFLKSQNDLNIIPIAANEEIYSRVSSILQQFDLRYVDASKADSPRILKQSFPGLTDAHLPALENVLQHLAGIVTANSPFIGMSGDIYHNLLEYCQDYGVRTIKNTVLPSELLKQKVRQAKEFILLTTTGASIIKTLTQDAFPKALSNGCRIHVILPNQHSDFCRDVAEIERPDDIAGNFARLDQEYTSTLGYLQEALLRSADANGTSPGSITCYCSHNLLRQTILLVKNQDDSVWTWFSLTMPPQRTADGTPSMEAQGKLEDGQMVSLLWKHCHSIMELSKRRGTWFTVSSQAAGSFYLEKDQAQAYWQSRLQTARQFMLSRRGQYDSLLIEVAAQHPLKKGLLPGEEFRRRLDLAVTLYEKYTDQGLEVCLYVPGSRHRHGTAVDKVSLSKAGTDYLLKQGIPAENLLGEDVNRQYKGDAGVYNSADECYVASQIFINGQFDDLICICSPNQLMRKTLFYIEFGVLPQCYGVPAQNMFHDPIGELFHSIHNVLYLDHSWQDPESEAFIRSRETRRVLE